MRFRGVFPSSCYCTSFFEVMSLRRIDWCVFAEVMLLYVLFFEVMSAYYISRAVFSRSCSRAFPRAFPSRQVAALCRRWRLAITKLMFFACTPGQVRVRWSAGVNYQHGTELILIWGSSAASA